MRKIPLILKMLCLLASSDFDRLSAATTNPEGQRIYRSAHYLGRGDTGIADADDQEAIFYNPAGLAKGSGIYKRVVLASPHIEISSQTREIYNRLQVEDDDSTEVYQDQVGKPFHVGLTSMTALVFRRAALGATTSNNVNMLVKKSPDYGGLETIQADLFSNQIVSFSLAESFFSETILIGGTGKYLSRGQAAIEANIIDAENIKDMYGDDLMKSGTGAGFDFGMMYKTAKNPRLTEQSLGLTITDIGNTYFATADGTGTAPDALKQAINLGYVLSVGTKFSRMKLLLDYLDVNGAYEPNTLKRLHLGSEINVKGLIGITSGLNQGYPTGGFYLDARFLRLDLGFYSEERDDRVGVYPDKRYFMRILVGL